MDFAEQFHIRPQDVRKTPVVVWERWLARRDALAARAATERSRVVEDWTRDLNAAEREAINWSWAIESKGNKP